MKRYTEEEKAAALRVIAAVGVSRASIETGIPERTLFTWQKLDRRRQPPLQMPHAANPSQADEDLRADGIMDDVLNHLMEQARVLSQRFITNYDRMPPTSQMMALTRLIDRIIKLDARKPRTGSKDMMVVRIIEVDDDEKMPKDW